MSDIADLRIFLAVAAQRSFAGAARSLSLTPAAVTRAVAALENRLGVQLLLRTTRMVSLTSAGAVYAARIAPIVAAFDAAADEVREEQGVASGLIRLNAPLSLGVRLLPDVVARFRDRYPETRISFTLTDSFVDIQADDCDLAIRISEQPTDKSTIWRKLCPVPRVLVASPDVVKDTGLPQTPEDLRRMPCLAYAQDGGDETWHLSKDGVSRSIQQKAAFSANNGDLLSALAVEGQGVALLPRFIVLTHLESGALVQVLPDWSAPRIWLTLYYPPYEKLPLRVAVFSDFFETYVTETRPLNLPGDA